MRDIDAIFTDGNAVELLKLLAVYADEYGADCPSDLTVADLADDLARSLDGVYAPKTKPTEWAAAVRSGLEA